MPRAPRTNGRARVAGLDGGRGPGRLGRDDQWLMPPGQQMLGHPEHAVRHAVDIGRERLCDDPDPPAPTMRPRHGPGGGHAMASVKTLDDNWPWSWPPDYRVFTGRPA